MPKKGQLKCLWCGSFDMEDMGTWFNCRKCGGTVSFIPKPGAYPLTSSRDYSAGGTTGSPSKSATRKAAKERL